MNASLIHQPLAETLHRERVAAGLAHDPRRVVAAATDGDARSWEVIVGRFGPQLLRVARAQGLTRQEAEDAVQETWVQCLRHLDQLREPRALGGWLTTTTRHQSVRLRARARREDPTGDAPGIDRAAPDCPVRELEAAECRAAVARALAALPPRRRALMEALLADDAGGYKDVAARLGIPIGSIGPTRGRCFEHLRRDDGLRALADALD